MMDDWPICRNEVELNFLQIKEKTCIVYAFNAAELVLFRKLLKNEPKGLMRQEISYDNFLAFSKLLSIKKRSPRQVMGKAAN